jgi:tetratricopeptide (TPR) repeat protein
VTLGCAGPAFPPGLAESLPGPAPLGCAELYQGGLGAEALGFSLAWLADDVPRDLGALGAWLQRQGGLTAVRVEPPAEGDLTGLTGPSRCPGIEPARLLVEADPARLRSVRPSPAAAQKEAAARSHFAAGRFPEGRADWAAAAASTELPLPAPALAVATSYEAEERFAQALDVYQELAARHPWSPEAHAGRGRALRGLLRRVDAVEAWGRALALRPRAPGLRSQVVGDAFAEVHPPLVPPATRLETAGQPVRWVQLPAADRDPASAQVMAEASAYASCKEAFRSSADLRRTATGREQPVWLWTPAEESVCAGVWLATYLRHRGEGRVADTGLDELAEIAREGFLDERALYDLGAWVHPGAPLLLDGRRRQRLFSFVEKYRVLPRRDAGWLFP